MKTEWDYTDRAHTYDARADYSAAAISKLVTALGLKKGQVVADVGAGTGKLTKLLLAEGLSVRAVEPNDNMRSYGIANTKGGDVQWSEGTGEVTGLEDHSVEAVLFGSSFNVVDQHKALVEFRRIVRPGGSFACMWNHRDIEDPVQKGIEDIIHQTIPSYNYGARRKDPSTVILESGFFDRVEKIEERFEENMSRQTIIDAWRSHDTLYRQAGESFDEIIEKISSFLTQSQYPVPYHTRIWHSTSVQK